MITTTIIGLFFSICGVGYILQDYKDYGYEAFHNTEGYVFIVVGLIILSTLLL